MISLVLFFDIGMGANVTIFVFTYGFFTAASYRILVDDCKFTRKAALITISVVTFIAISKAYGSWRDDLWPAPTPFDQFQLANEKQETAFVAAIDCLKEPECMVSTCISKYMDDYTASQNSFVILNFARSQIKEGKCVFDANDFDNKKCGWRIVDFDFRIAKPEKGRTDVSYFYIKGPVKGFKYRSMPKWCPSHSDLPIRKQLPSHEQPKPNQ